METNFVINDFEGPLDLLLHLVKESNIDIKDTLMIGGAGYNYPKYFISHYQDKTMDVVEIDGEITNSNDDYISIMTNNIKNNIHMNANVNNFNLKNTNDHNKLNIS